MTKPNLAMLELNTMVEQTTGSLPIQTLGSSEAQYPTFDHAHDNTQSHSVDSVQEVTGFYDMMRSYWNELSGFDAPEPTIMLNFGYWPEGVANLRNAQFALLKKITANLTKFQTEGAGLEIGCGIGGISISVLQQLPGARIVGVDISEHQLSLAKRNAEKDQVQDRFLAQLGDSMDLPFPDARFDFCLCIESSFHYIDKRAFFEECFRTLKPGGLAIIADITCSNLEGVLFRHGNHFEAVQQYRDHIDACGFQLLSQEDIGPQVYLPLYKHVLAFNRQRRNQVARYWSRVLRNYWLLAEAAEMGYHIFVVQKPEEAPLAA